MTTTVQSDNVKDTFGGKVKNLTGDTDKAYMDSDDLVYVVAQYLQTYDGNGDAEAPAYTYTKKLSAHRIIKKQRGASRCSVTIEDPAKTKISDFSDGSYGFKYNLTNADRHYFVVQRIAVRDTLAITGLSGSGPWVMTTSDDITNTADSNSFTDSAGNKYLVDSIDRDAKTVTVSDGFTVGSPPAGTGTAITKREPVTEGQAFADQNTDILLFAGFNRTGAKLDLDLDKISADYTGLEAIGDDLTVQGTINFNYIRGVADLNRTRHSYGDTCIFNEDGQPDLLDATNLNLQNHSRGTGGKAGTTNDRPYFNKTGAKPRKFWSYYDIIDYLLHWYLAPVGVFEYLPEEFQVAKKNVYHIDGVLMKDVATLKSGVPTDLNIEGMGAYEALEHVVRETKTHFLGINYKADGMVEYFVKPKSIRDTYDLPMVMARADFLATYDKTKIVEDSGLYLNREMSQVGKVIVMGDKVRINTCATTIADKQDMARAGTTTKNKIKNDRQFTYLDSSGVEVTTGIFEFYYYFHLVPVAQDNKDGIEKITFKVSNYQATNGWQEYDEMPISIANLNGDIDRFLFDTFRLCSMQTDRNPATSDKKLVDKSMQVFVCDDITDATPWKKIYLQTEDSSQVFDTQPVNGSTGGFILKAKTKLANDKFLSVIADSPLVPLVPYNQSYIPTTVTTVLPMIAKFSLETDYRIKGIAKIAGYDPKKHTTMIIRDNKFQLNVSFKDLEYGKDTAVFTAVPDGTIKLADGTTDSDALNPVEKIQDLAEKLLIKYNTVVQNSGGLPLTGIQESIAVNDQVNEIEGGARTFAFPTIINDVDLDLDERITFVTFGAIDE